MQKFTIFVGVVLVIILWTVVWYHNGYMDGLHDGWWRGTQGQLMY